jgi:hypothetical protein
MSLDNRVIAALGAVVVIGAGTLGGSIAYASGQPSPQTNQATITVGRNSHHFEPTCYNGGQPLTDSQNTQCQALYTQTSKFPTIDVKSLDRIGVGVTLGAADNGWRSYTNGGGTSGSASIAPFQKGNTFSGLVPAADVLTQTRDTTLAVVEFDPKTENQQQPNIIAAWFINLRNDAYPVAPSAEGGATQGQ